MDTKLIGGIAASVILLAIISLMALSALLRRGPRRLFGIVAVVLHLPMLFCLFLSGVALKTVLLIYLFSALSYTFFSFISLKLEANKTKSDREGTEE